VLPRAGGVLETLLRKLARGLWGMGEWGNGGMEKRKSNGPGALARPRPLPFQQRTNTSCHLSMPTRGFTAVLRCLGAHLQGSPLDCKFVSRLSTCAAPAPGNTLPAADGGPLASETCWRRKTSPRAQPGRSNCHFVFFKCPLPSLPKQKTLLTTRQAGFENLSIVFLEPAHPESAQIALGVLCRQGNKRPKAAHDAQTRPFVRCRRSDDRLRSERH